MINNTTKIYAVISLFKCVSMAQQKTGLPLHLVSEDIWEEIAQKLDL